MGQETPSLLLILILLRTVEVIQRDGTSPYICKVKEEALGGFPAPAPLLETCREARKEFYAEGRIKGEQSTFPLFILLGRVTLWPQLQLALTKRFFTHHLRNLSR